MYLAAYYFMCIGVWSACISVKVPDPLELELRTATKLARECRELNSGPREEQPVLFSACWVISAVPACLTWGKHRKNIHLTLGRTWEFNSQWQTLEEKEKGYRKIKGKQWRDEEKKAKLVYLIENEKDKSDKVCELSACLSTGMGRLARKLRGC